MCPNMGETGIGFADQIRRKGTLNRMQEGRCAQPAHNGGKQWWKKKQ